MKVNKRWQCLLAAAAVMASSLSVSAETLAAQTSEALGESEAAQALEAIGESEAVQALEALGESEAAETVNILINDDFETGEIGLWEGRDGSLVSVTDAEPHGGDYCLKASGRTGTWQGPQIKLEDLKNNQVLLVTAYVKYTEGPEQKVIQASLQTGSQLSVLAGAELTKGEWGKIEGKMILSEDAEASEIRLFFETSWTAEQSETDDWMDFYVDDVTVSVSDLSDISDYPSLKELYQDAFYIGVAAPNQVLTTEAYSRIVKQQFNSLTMENEMKPAYLMDQSASLSDLETYRERVALNFDSCKTGMDYAKENGISMRGHTLVWHSQTPDWFFYENYDTSGELAGRELMLKRMENYIRDVVCWTETNYPGVIYAWDVVNEAVADPWGLGLEEGEPSPMRQEGSLWYQTVGEDFVEQAFAFARKYTGEYAPDHKIKLFYNDYNEYFRQKRDGIIELLRPIREAGNLDGVGMQSHIDVDWDLYGDDGYMTALRKFSEELGVEIHVTELDVGMTSEEHTEASQGAFYQEFMEALIEERYRGADIASVTFWGLTDGLSWRQGENALLFREDFSRKPAFEGVVKAAELIAEKEAERNLLAAQEAAAAIGAIGEISYTEESKGRIDAAREAYEALSDAQKALVENYGILTDAEAKYQELKEAAEQKAEEEKQEEDKRTEGETQVGETDHSGTGESGNQNAADEENAGSSLKEGDVCSSGGYRYQITSLSRRTVSVVGAGKKTKTISLKDTVKLDGVAFQITAVGKNAFWGNGKVTAVKLGKNVETIGAGAFGGCRKLKKVTVKSGKLKKIDAKAFYGCKRLSSVKITSAKLKTVGKQAFGGTPGNMKLDVPNKKIKAYRKLFQKGGLAKSAAVK